MAAVGLAGALLLGSGALAALPAAVRVAAALTVLVLLPGLGWRRAIGAPGPGGAWLALGWALGYGVAWLGLGVLLSRALGLPFTVLARFGAPWALLPWLAAARFAPVNAPPQRTLSRSAGLAVAAAALLAGIHGAQLGTPVSYITDSPDHIGTVRRMLASGDAFPTDAFFRDAGPAGADPRKGLWHSGVALVCALSHTDPLVGWRVLAALLAPLFVLNAAGFAWWLGGGVAAAAGAWGLLLTYGGGLGTQYLREAVFATKLADQLSLATAAAVLADLESRSARSRLAVLGLLLGTVAAHVFGAIQFAVVFGALGLGLVVRDRGWSPIVSRLALTACAGAAVTLPYLLWRAQQSYAPSNIIHTEPQGLLELAPGLTIVSFGAVWDWLGRTWLLFPLSLVAWARAAARPAALYLLTTTLAVAALMFLPPVVAVLEPRLGYLLMRFPWLLPPSAAVAFLVTAAHVGWRGGRRLAPVAAVLLLAVSLAGPLADAVHAFTDSGRVRAADAEGSVERWGDALAWMERELPAGTVVLSDPATSYSVPMLTRHWVTALVDQHSSPNDSLALTRILDARDALDPYAPWSRTASVVRRWGATAIALNGRWPQAPDLDYWAPDAAWYDAARARLESAPSAFERVYEHDRFSVYVIHADSLAALTGGEHPRPFVRALAPADRARSFGPELPELVSFRSAPAVASPGDTLAGCIEWHSPGALPAGSYRVAVRFDRPLPPGTPAAPSAISKLWRKFIESRDHQRYRFRANHLPVAGAYGVDRWSAGEVVRDTFRIEIPADVAAGDYTVKVAMIRTPHYPNLRLADLTSDADALDGMPVAALRVVRAGGR
jgi:hypothetical protein